MEKQLLIKTGTSFPPFHLHFHFWYSSMVLAPDFERQNISLVTEQRLRGALTSFGLWPRSHFLVTKEILKPFEN